MQTEWVPRYIKQTFDARPGHTVTADRWNELWTLVCDTLDYNSETLYTLVQNATALQSNVLLKDNTEPYNPTSLYHPATLKYVDDSLAVVQLDLSTQIRAHANNVTNPHNVTKAQVGLGNVDNTKDLDKPLSTAAQAALSLKVDKVEGKSLSTNDYTNADKAAIASIADKVSASDVLTKTNTIAYNPTAPYHPATKDYVDQLALEAGAMRSFNGRSGAVMPQEGDYTAAMVGAADAGVVQALSTVVSSIANTLDTKASKDIVAYGTIVASAWDGTSAPYTYSYQHGSITETTVVEISPAPTITAAQLEAYQAANLVGGATGSMWAAVQAFGEKPTINIPILVVIRR